MKRLSNYLKGTLLSPQKTFETLIQDPKATSYIIWLIISLGLIAVLNQLVPKQPLSTQTTPTGESINRFLQGLSNYLPFLSIPIWSISGLLLHLIARLFTKQGSFLTLLSVTGFIGVTGGLVTLILNLINIYVPIWNVASPIVSLWLFYLTILAVSSLYAIPKLKAFITVLMQTVALTLIFIASMFAFVLKNLQGI